MTKAAIYARCSTQEQDEAMQLTALRSLCESRGWTVYREYIDHGVSGAKDSRPELDRMMADARAGRFRICVVWRFDRMARSVSHLLRVLDEFRALGIDFVSQQESVDTSTPMGKCMFTICGAFSEMERETIRSRVRAGIAHAKQNGTKRGNPIGRPASVFDRALAREMREAGQSWADVARAVGVPVGTVRSAISRAKEAV